MDFFNKFHFASIKNFQNIILLSIIIIVVLLFTLYYILQEISENNIRESLFENQMKNQLDTNQALSKHISSDIELLLTRLEIISEIGPPIEEKNYPENITISELQNIYNKSRNLLAKSDLVFLADKSGNIQSTYPLSINANNSVYLILNNLTEYSTFQNISNQNYFKEAKDTKKPVFSTGQSFLQNTNNSDAFRLIISNPIVEENTGNFLGLIGISLSVNDFFKRLGNIYDIKSSYLAVLDNNGTQLVHGNNNLIGKNFFDKYTQDFINQNENLNELVYNVSVGNPGFVVYSINNLGERLTTGFPIFIADEDEIPKYMVFIITPTSQIFNQIENLLFIQRIETFSLLFITAGSVIVLILFLIKWNNKLEKEVKNRTKDLVKSNHHLKDLTRQLQTSNDSLLTSNLKVKEINEKLELKDKLQKEFINIAAHELRTPVQALVGYSELLNEDKGNMEKYIMAILRNSERLEKLTNNILDTSRIENNLFYLKKETFNLSQLIYNIVQDFKKYDLNVQNEKTPNHDVNGVLSNSDTNTHLSKINNRNNTIRWKYYIDPEVYLYADKERITQVITNLCSNAMNFTKTGTIEISLKKLNDKIIFEIRDTGTGIELDILPKLFTKFVTKSISGTGLGLFISKNIIEAHGGKIWAKNNSEHTNDDDVLYHDNNNRITDDINQNSLHIKYNDQNRKKQRLTGATIGFSLPLSNNDDQ